MIFERHQKRALLWSLKGLSNLAGFQLLACIYKVGRVTHSLSASGRIDWSQSLISIFLAKTDILSKIAILNLTWSSSRL